MGYDNPSGALIFLVAAGVVVVLAAFLVRRRLARRPPLASGVPVAAITVPQTASRHSNTAVAVMTKDPGKPASVPHDTSYAAIAVAAAARAAPHSASVQRPATIDYSNEATEIQPGASYTAIAVATTSQRFRLQRRV